MALPSPAFWSVPEDELLGALGTSARGLASGETAERLARYGYNELRAESRVSALALFFAQFRSSIVLILLFAAGLSFFLQDPTDALIIVAIVLASAGLGFWQERGAADAVQRLLATVRTRTTVMRDGRPVEVAARTIVPGDVVLLSAGDAIPGDCRILQSKDLYVVEATLTGETFPAEKAAGTLPAETPLARRASALFLGTHVASGAATAVVVHTGKSTEFGAISERLRLRPPETEFERGVRRFGYLLAEVTLLLVVGIFAINVYLERPVIEAFLFSLALAVGLTPQLLPAIISVNLAHGARRMAVHKVIVRRLSSIENLGSMDVLCSDKTGTLTEGLVRLHSAVALDGTPSERVLRFAYLNAFYESGFANPIDEAIRSYQKLDLAGYRKVDEVPYDFVRKRLSIMIAKDGTNLMVTKGAMLEVVAACDAAESADGSVSPIAAVRAEIDRHFHQLSAQGLRTLGVAYRAMGGQAHIGREDEVGMTFAGFLVLFDPPKAGIVETIAELRRLGVALKIITGDNRLLAETVGRQVGLAAPRVLTGPELRRMSDEAVRHALTEVDLVAEVEPNQKERIILALKKSGHVVGYLGDGINDASALHAADVGLSVEGAVDVAKEAADIVLLERSLDVIVSGVREGRTTFANTLKYVFMATSANFGNMFSMAGVSLFLPFLPLLPKQILLTNLLTDLPEMAIATDRVDTEWVERPRRWNIQFIRSFMIVFGALSSVFDFLTFGVLRLVLHATTEQFRTGWFVESVLSASLIVLVVRSRGSCFRTRPGGALLAATLLVGVVTLVLPVTPVARLMGFTVPPLTFLPALALIVVAYLVSAELTKRVFYARVRY